MSRARAVVATGRRPRSSPGWLASVAKRSTDPITAAPAAAGPGKGRPGDDAIVEVAKANPTDGTRMVAALASP